ncbi:protein disulfide isomerase-like 1-6 [Cucumis melo var. makuwa]|uniref:Protein disulfide isomerase-like 1-6 n=1 Tax=Cucumis melo var. makuwa TaxID=1194695 RepID=A0A5A7U405_CUCMM|nr:protein disulfide isomerase-like 1-6 [Cucumis melo var. makuwa]
MICCLEAMVLSNEIDVHKRDGDKKDGDDEGDQKKVKVHKKDGDEEDEVEQRDQKNVKVAAFDNRIGSKFLLESDSSSSNIEEFARGLYDGTLSPYFISQLIPNNDGASIEIVVGRTFDELDLKNTNNVFLGN